MGTTFVVAGDLASFDAAAFEASLLAAFPEAESAKIIASAASVRVDATITLRSASAAQSAASRLEAATVEQLSEKLGVRVESVAHPVLTSPADGTGSADGRIQTLDEANQAALSAGGSAGGEGENTDVIVWRSAAITAMVALAMVLLCLIRARRRRIHRLSRARSSSAFGQYRLYGLRYFSRSGTGPRHRPGAEKYAGERQRRRRAHPFPSTILGVSTSRATSTEPAKVGPLSNGGEVNSAGQLSELAGVHEQRSSLDRRISSSPVCISHRCRSSQSLRPFRWCAKCACQ